MASKNNDVDEQSFEEKLWEAAEKLRGPLESAQYKYVVLGLLFLKFASDIFLDRQKYLIVETKNPSNKEYFQKKEESREFVINDPDEYHKESVLFIRKGNNWDDLMKSASQENLGITIDRLLNEIENDNPVLLGVMPKNYSSIKLPNENISELINLFSSIKHGETRGADFDFLGRTYEFFLGKFSSKEDTRAGEFYTPSGIVKIITKIIEPTHGKVFDPTCGSGGMFVQSMEFHDKILKDSQNDLSFYAQEFKEGIWQICKMNLILRGIDTSNIFQGDSLVNDHHPNLKAQYIMANPPFNMKEWGYNQLKSDKRFKKFGLPSHSKAGGNFAFMQHMLSHLDEEHGKMGLVLANRSVSDQGDEGEIRKKIIDADLVDCVISLPIKLFYTTQIPVTLWFFTSNKNDRKTRKRDGEVLFIHAINSFEPIKRNHNEITPKHINHITSTYRAYVDKENPSKYKNEPGFCKSVKKETIIKNHYSLVPGVYIDTKETKQDTGKLFNKKMNDLLEEYISITSDTNKIDSELRKKMKGLNFEI